MILQEGDWDKLDDLIERKIDDAFDLVDDCYCGVRYLGGDAQPCSKCNNTGKRLTKRGEKLRDFLNYIAQKPGST